MQPTAGPAGGRLLHEASSATKQVGGPGGGSLASAAVYRADVPQQRGPNLH